MNGGGGEASFRFWGAWGQLLRAHPGSAAQGVVRAPSDELTGILDKLSLLTLDTTGPFLYWCEGEMRLKDADGSCYYRAKALGEGRVGVLFAAENAATGNCRARFLLGTKPMTLPP